MKTKLESLAALITTHQRARWDRCGYTHDLDPGRPGCAWVATVKPGRKFTKIDVGTSGKYMVDNATGEIFGIRAYGVVHRGHRFGTLDTIQDWDWSGYVARLKPTGKYVGATHQTIEQICATAQERVRNGEQAAAVVEDLVIGYCFGFGSANAEAIKHAAEQGVA